MISSLRPTLKGFIVLLILIAHSLSAQPPADSLMAAFSWRNIGPANQGGRVVDIEAVDGDFTRLLAATGSGGVWKSENAGNSWEPIFDNYSTASIGDVAIFQPNPDIIWVGTGEANNRNSVSWGNGIYRSTDGGKTFQHLGLENTHQIARVVPHPTDPNTAYVAAIGHLWGFTGDRGLFQTADGGKTWSKLTNGLPNDGETGCTDLVMDPKNPKVLYAAFYRRLRQPWHFHSGGDSGGIFKSTDGGKSWKKLTNGLPPGPTGRIGLAIYRKDPKILMALVEAKQSNSLDTLGSGLYRTEDGGKSWTYVNTYNNRPFYYSQVRINPNDHQRVYLLTTRFMVSTDGGKTLNDGSEDQEVHGDFHAMWLDPTDADRYYLGADKGISITQDHGRHFVLFDNIAIGQFYRIGADMRDPYYVYGGLQDNGFYATASFTRDARGILNDSNWKVHWGDGQYACPDPTDWRTVFTSMENGSIFRYDPLTHQLDRISPSPRTIVNYEAAVPEGVRDNGREFRFNWSAPMVMSPHDPHTLYLGGNYLFRSSDQGKSWQIISPDLSTNDPGKAKEGESGGVTPDNTGAETHCTIFSIGLSPVDPQVIWAGTDDGLVQVTRNGGKSWTNVRTNISGVPDGIWVSRVAASHFNAGTAYVTFDGHRSDRNEPWVFKTTDYGQTWTDLRNNLPGDEVIRVIIEDRRNPNLLFLGTETGIWASLNGGKRWVRWNLNLPTVSVYDLQIHPRDNDLIAGTHGRSIWIMDDISPLQQLTEEVMNAEGYLFAQRPATLWENVSRGGQRGHFLFAGDNPPTIVNTSSVPRAEFKNTAMITYLIGDKVSGPVNLEITNISGQNKRFVELDAATGIHRYQWDLEFDVDWLTPEQKTKLDGIFKQLAQQYDFALIRRAYRDFQNAKTPREQREAVEVLRGGYLSFPLSEEYGIPKAGTGTYVVKLRVGDKEWRQSLEIRTDPLKGPR